MPPKAKPKTARQEEKGAILIVDANDSSRRLVRSLLRQNAIHNDRIREANSVSAAIDLLQKEPFVLLLCDVDLDRNARGIDLLRSLRNSSNPALRDEVSVVMMDITLNHTLREKNKREAMQFGIQGYLTKPFSAATLLKTLQQLPNFSKL